MKRAVALPSMLLLSVTSLACTPTATGETDAGTTGPMDAGSVLDASQPDARATPDAAVAPDAAMTSDAGMSTPDAASPPDAAVTTTDAGTQDAGTMETDAGTTGPRTLPVSYQRPDDGTPVTATELAAVTDLYVQLLQGTRYFQLVDSRVHGWPESDPLGQYWYGTWWSGITVQKSGGVVTYTHSVDGADNNGLRTAQLMEGACFAFRTWRRPQDEMLLRRLMRGFSSWLMAMKRNATDTEGPLMARAAYPAPFTDTVRGIVVDYAPDRPGQGGPTADYVHLPDNPFWGDTWVRNKRSKDDIGHMQRAIAQVDTCATLFTTPEARAEYDDMRARHAAFAARVIDDGLRIATLDTSLNPVLPTEQFSYFVQLVECPAVQSLHLMAHGAPEGVDCGDGLRPGEGLGFVNSSAMQIVRTYHESATNLALLHRQDALGLSLLGGLANRVQYLVNAFNGGSPPSNINQDDLTQLIIHSINTGVPLTSTEVRWMHDRIREAHASYLDGHNDSSVRLFEPATPDGTYAYEPSGTGIRFNDVGALLGACAAQFSNPSGRPVLDCARLAAAQP